MLEKKLNIYESKNKLFVEVVAQDRTLSMSLIIWTVIVILVSAMIFTLYQILTRWAMMKWTWWLALIFLALFLWYLFRLILWNQGGKEVLLIENNQLTHYSDYKWFKLGKKKHSFNSISFLTHIIDDDKPKVDKDNILDQIEFDDDIALLGIQIDNHKVVETNIEMPMQELRKIVDAYYKNFK